MAPFKLIINIGTGDLTYPSKSIDNVMENDRTILLLDPIRNWK